MRRNLPTGTRQTTSDGRRALELQPIGADFDDLIDSLVRRNIKVILLRNCRRDEAGTGVNKTTETDGGSGGCGTYRPPIK